MKKNFESISRILNYGNSNKKFKFFLKSIFVFDIVKFTKNSVLTKAIYFLEKIKFTIFFFFFLKNNLEFNSRAVSSGVALFSALMLGKY